MRNSSVAGVAAVLLGTTLACSPAFAPSTPPPTATTASPQPASALQPPATDRERHDRLRAAFPQVDRAFQSFAQTAHAPGIAYGVVIDGALAHAGQWGVRDVPSKGAIDADTIFRIASMTKSFTAALILSLRDEGRLSLDDPAERYVPELQTLTYPTRDSPKITLRHLLSHAEGFPEDNPWGDRQLAVTDDEMRQMLVRGIPFSNPPGLAYEYSNYGFAILGRIVTRVTGTSYKDALTRRLLRPLGMTSTYMEAADVPAGRLARGYRWEDERWKDEPPLPDGAFGPMGGMLTSSRDLTKWVGFLSGAWPPRDEADTGPVRRASLREMQQIARTRPASARSGPAGELTLTALGYGYGLRIQQSCEFNHVVSHTGGLPGFGSVMTWLPEYGIGVISMANLTYTSASAVANEVLSMLVRSAGLRPRAAAPSAGLVQAQRDVTSLITQWDDGLADRIAAENLYLDQDKARRRAAIEALRAKVGACPTQGPFDVENALRGQWTMKCERGDLRVAITLAPSMPPLVQHLAVDLVDPAQPAAMGTCAAVPPVGR